MRSDKHNTHTQHTYGCTCAAAHARFLLPSARASGGSGAIFMIIGNECDRKVTRSLSHPDSGGVGGRATNSSVVVGASRGTNQHTQLWRLLSVCATFNQIGILCDLISRRPVAAAVIGTRATGAHALLCFIYTLAAGGCRFSRKRTRVLSANYAARRCVYKYECTRDRTTGII